jgi:hypothetical protein
MHVPAYNGNSVVRSSVHVKIRAEIYMCACGSHFGTGETGKEGTSLYLCRESFWKDIPLNLNNRQKMTGFEWLNGDLFHSVPFYGQLYDTVSSWTMSFNGRMTDEVKRIWKEAWS